MEASGCDARSPARAQSPAPEVSARTSFALRPGSRSLDNLVTAGLADEQIKRSRMSVRHLEHHAERVELICGEQAAACEGGDPIA